MRAFVALHPETRQRLAVAWSELDAYEMLKVADTKVADGIAELTQVEVTRTPKEMRAARIARAEEAKRRREAEEFLRRERALDEPTAPVPDGYRVRVPHNLSAAGRRRWNAEWQHELSQIVAADGWVSIVSGPYGTATSALANRGLILIADPIEGRGPILYCATGRAKAKPRRRRVGERV